MSAGLVQVERFDCRVAFAEELAALAEADQRIVAVCNDSVGSSNLVAFAARFPQRLVNVGIAEQDMVGVAAGLANGGLVPFVCGAAPFLTGRAIEQIKVDVAYSEAKVVLCGMSPGFAYGVLGPTHHSVEDLAWMRAIAGLNVVVPADPAQTRAALRWALEAKGPSYLRIPRTKVPELTGVAPEIGRALLHRPGNDVTLLCAGTTTPEAILASEALAEEGISARVLQMSTLRPFDAEALEVAARETGAIVSAEEGVLAGGLGSAAASWLAERHPVAMRMLGLRDEFAPTGGPEALASYFGLTAQGIAGAARQLLSGATSRNGRGGGSR